QIMPDQKAGLELFCKLVIKIQNQIGVNIPVSDPGFCDESQAIVFMHIFVFNSGWTWGSKKTKIGILVETGLVPYLEPVRDIVLNSEISNVPIYIVREFISFSTIYRIIPYP